MRYFVGLASATACFIAVCLLAFAHQVQANHVMDGTRHYSYPWGSDCNNNPDRVDPVGIVFWNLATTSRVNSNINAHTNVDHGATPFGAQDFGWNGGCFHQTVDKSTCAQWTCDRIHVRGFQAPTSNPTWGTTTQTTPHDEDWIAPPFPWQNCYPGNHAVDEGGISTQTSSGFDVARDHIFTGFLLAGHGWEVVYWGNTEEQPQCDGQWAGSTGWVYYIKISHGH